MKSQPKAHSKTATNSKSSSSSAGASAKKTPAGKAAKPASSAMMAKKATPVKKKSAAIPPKKSAPAAAKKTAPAKSPAKPAPAAKKTTPAPVAKKASAKPDLKDMKKKPMAAPAAKQAAQHAANAASKEKKSAVAPTAAAPKKIEKASEKSSKPTEAAKPTKSMDAPVPATAEPVADAAGAAGAEAAVKPSTLVGKGEKSSRKAKDDGMTIEEVKAEGEIVLTDAEGRRYCRVKDCDQIALVDSYCRYHYLLFWKNIQVRKKILSEGKLERYIEELTARYPDKYLDMLRKDLRNEKDFQAAIQELEIDEASVDNEYEDEAQSYLEEVRGMSSEGGSAREEEDF